LYRDHRGVLTAHSLSLGHLLTVHRPLSERMRLLTTRYLYYFDALLGVGYPPPGGNIFSHPLSLRRHPLLLWRLESDRPRPTSGGILDEEALGTDRELHLGLSLRVPLSHEAQRPPYALGSNRHGKAGGPAAYLYTNLHHLTSPFPCLLFGSSTGTLCPLFRRLALASFSPPALGADLNFLVVVKG
jgi:hypothetical protein